MEEDASIQQYKTNITKLNEELFANESTQSNVSEEERERKSASIRTKIRILEERLRKREKKDEAYDLNGLQKS